MRASRPPSSRFVAAVAVAGALAAGSVACGGGASAHATLGPRVPIANFREVSPGVYRGAHPDEAGLDYLARVGVKTIVDLEVADVVEALPWEIAAEERGAAERKIALLRFPMSAFEAALSDRFDRRMDAALAAIRDPARRPIFIHCKHGQDRTGLVVGLERVFDEGWTPRAAHDEMVALGFHTFFLGLDAYFDRKTKAER